MEVEQHQNRQYKLRAMLRVYMAGRIQRTLNNAIGICKQSSSSPMPMAQHAQQHQQQMKCKQYIYIRRIIGAFRKLSVGRRARLVVAWELKHGQLIVGGREIYPVFDVIIELVVWRCAGGRFVVILVIGNHRGLQSKR